MDTDLILSNISKLISYKNITRGKFADSIGVDKSNLYAFLSKRKPIGMKSIGKIVSTYKVNEFWLLTGEGDMFKDYPTESKPYTIPIDDSMVISEPTTQYDAPNLITSDTQKFLQQQIENQQKIIEMLQKQIDRMQTQIEELQAENKSLRETAKQQRTVGVA